MSADGAVEARSASDAVEIRSPTGAERVAAARLIFDPPGPEMAAIAGDAGRARAFGEGLVAQGVVPGPGQEVFAAFASGRPVGVLVVEGPGDRGHTGLGIGTVAPLALRRFRPWQIPGLAWRAWLRSQLDFPLPSDALHVVELHVAPDHRGRGIGGRLLAHAEGVARERGAARLVLSTLATNPARRLYERHGYRVIAERTVVGYRALTGSPGRVFMERPVAKRVQG